MKYILMSLLTFSMLNAGPIHGLMDSRIIGQSYGGTIGDSSAASDGLGGVVLQSTSSSSLLNNELATQKELANIINSSNTPIDNAKDYLNTGKTIHISGSGLNEGDTVKVFNKTYLLGEQTVSADGNYDIELSNLTVGIWQLTIQIISPTGEIISETTENVAVYNPDTPQTVIDNPLMTKEPIIGVTKPNTIVEIYDSKGNLVATTKSDSQGVYVAEPVGLSPDDKVLNVVVDDQPIGSVAVELVPETQTALDAVVKAVANTLTAMETSSPVIGTPLPTNIVPTAETTVPAVGSETVQILKPYGETPSISGIVQKPYSQVIVSINGIVVGKTLTGPDVNWTVYLLNLDQLGINLDDPNIYLKITVTDASSIYAASSSVDYSRAYALNSNIIYDNDGYVSIENWASNNMNQFTFQPPSDIPKTGKTTITVRIKDDGSTGNPGLAVKFGTCDDQYGLYNFIKEPTSGTADFLIIFDNGELKLISALGKYFTNDNTFYWAKGSLYNAPADNTCFKVVLGDGSSYGIASSFKIMNWTYEP